MTSKATLREDLHHLMIEFQQMKSFCEEPCIIASAKGTYLTDVYGKRYLDGLSGIYVANIGHGNEQVIEAIRKQQERAFFVAPLHAVADITIRPPRV